MKLLITGSSGFIGSKLTEELRAQNIEFDILKRTNERVASVEGVVQANWPEDILRLDLAPYSAVIHLAAAPSTQTAKLSSLRESNLMPVDYFLRRISQVNPNCSFVFVTSQSAKANTESVYGSLKWEAEELIRKHSGYWTIIRPGLVIGEGGKGLFNRLLTVVEKSPAIPLVGDGSQLLQPVDVKQVVKALVIVAKEKEKYSDKDYALVGHAVSLKEFLGESAKVLGKKPIFLPIPVSLVNFGLTVLELIVPNPPVTRTNLLGLLNLDLLDPGAAYEELGIAPLALKETLESALQINSSSEMEVEAKYFYQILFGRRPSRLIIDRYIAAHRYCCFIQSPEQKIEIQKICKNKLDAESIEYATRSRRTLLTKKLTLLTYLAEVEAINYSIFVNQKRNFLLGFFLLGAAVLRAPWKLLKGKYLVWRYSLV